jgi:AraC-like DNA-binding protein
MSYTDNIYNYNIKINNAVYQECDANWSWQCRSGIWRGDMLWLVTGGEALLKHRDGSIALNSGDLVLMPMSKDYWYDGSHHSDNPLIVYWIYFTAYDELDHVKILDQSDGFDFYRKVKGFTFTRGIVERITNLEEPQKVYWLKMLLLEIRNQQQAESYDYNHEKIISLCDQIKSHPEKDNSIGRLAKKQGCTRDHFIKLFKKYTGHTPGDYIINAKIDIAMNMLKMSNASIIEIADKLGYSDRYTFSKQFKQKTGMSPARFRQS